MTTPRLRWQSILEKQIKGRKGGSKDELGRECLPERAWAWKALGGQRGRPIVGQLRRLGYSGDWKA